LASTGRCPAHATSSWFSANAAIPTNSEFSVPQVRMLLHQVESILGRSVRLEEWNDL
jgi:hypothetical protein